jgi:hypothetical protein
LQQSLDAWVGKAQRRYPLGINHERLIHLLEGGFADMAVVPDGLDVRQASVGLTVDLPQGGQVQ